MGWVGEIHPLVVREWDLASTGAQPAVAGFELDLGLLATVASEDVPFRDVVSFPPVIQDIAVVVENVVTAAAVESAVRQGGGELLTAIEIFDLYTGDQVGEGNKSLALRLEFRAPDRTLTDEEVAERRSAIEESLGGIGGRLRA